jgi:hypothetical protein
MNVNEFRVLKHESADIIPWNLNAVCYILNSKLLHKNNWLSDAARRTHTALPST